MEAAAITSDVGVTSLCDVFPPLALAKVWEWVAGGWGREVADPSKIGGRSSGHSKKLRLSAFLSCCWLPPNQKSLSRWLEFMVVKKLSSIFDSVSSRSAGPGGAGAGSKGGVSGDTAHGSRVCLLVLFFLARGVLWFAREGWDLHPKRRGGGELAFRRPLYGSDPPRSMTAERLASIREVVEILEKEGGVELLWIECQGERFGASAVYRNVDRYILGAVVVKGLRCLLDRI